MRGKSLALLALALGCGLVASLGITQVMARRGETGPPGDTQTVLVAVKEVPMGSLLSPQDVKLEEWPKDKVPAGALTRTEDVEGRRVKQKLYPHDFLLDQKLLSKDASGGGYDALIPKGYRVATVRVDAQSGGAGLLLPGSRVDLLVHVTRNPAIGFAETTTKTVLQDIRVFAVNDVVNMEASGPETKTITARTVSLLVTPSQAEKITLAGQLGQINLVMRPPEDDAKTLPPGATPHELLGTSDGSKRDQESLVRSEPAPVPNAGAALQNAGKLMSMFESMRKKRQEPAPSATKSPAEKPKWPFRLLKGPEVVDLELEEQAAESGRGAGLSHWKVTGGAGVSAGTQREIAPGELTRLDAGTPSSSGQEPKPGKEPPSPGKDESKGATDKSRPMKDDSKSAKDGLRPGTDERKAKDTSGKN